MFTLMPPSPPHNPVQIKKDLTTPREPGQQGTVN